MLIVPSGPVDGRVETVEDSIQYFKWDHLPPRLQEISKPFGELADRIVSTTNACPQRTMALEHLLIAKDAAVRAALAK